MFTKYTDNDKTASWSNRVLYYGAEICRQTLSATVQFVLNQHKHMESDTVTGTYGHNNSRLLHVCKYWTMEVSPTWTMSDVSFSFLCENVYVPDDHMMVIGGLLWRCPMILLYLCNPFGNRMPVGFITSLIARFMGQHGAHLGPPKPRRAPCWPMNIVIWADLQMPTGLIATMLLPTHHSIDI